MIDYSHSKNVHTLEGPRAALPAFFRNIKPASLLDVGCGTGTWMKAAEELGIADVLGIDGIEVPPDQRLTSPDKFILHDLIQPWNLGRRFDVALCLEVAEHIESLNTSALLDALACHSDTVFFSAACPGQPGQHHVNCQWPSHWQEAFNERGYVCSDAVRWRIWDDDRIEPWYRQNLFVAVRDPAAAGKEERIKPVIHPRMYPFLVEKEFPVQVQRIEQGSMPLSWYFYAPLTALSSKIARHLAKIGPY